MRIKTPDIVAGGIWLFLVGTLLLLLQCIPAKATTSVTSFATSTGWTQLDQKTSGANPTFSSIPQTYNDLMVVYDATVWSLSTNLGSEISGNNGSSVSASFTVSGANTTTQSGAFIIPNYKLNSGLIEACASITAASPLAVNCGGNTFMWHVTGGINWILTNTGSATLSSGTITLYGR